ncbi:MAG: MerR family transcriptional regulator [Eubacteriales bacterium]|nr:MerR family transcriptional regulator [Eubacteriales bacterium]
MLKIGEFSKLSMLTVKTLRYYEKEGLLCPSSVDPQTGYRFYETRQLETAARIKALRQLDFSVDAIRRYLSGEPVKDALAQKERELKERRTDIDTMISVIKFLSEDTEMKYQAVLKTIPECTVYSEERVLKDYGELTQLVLESAEECLRLNPGLECSKPDYCFCEYLDGEYRETDIRTRYSQAVVKRGKENERIKFRTVPETKALCIYHKGSYDLLGEAYSYVVNFAKANGYEISGFPRECYIDGVWNESCVENWLTEIQLPVK